jgi:glycosyltransferase involved in cell wall biosynthesis
MPDGHPWPRISIVTPSYSQGRFIEETIRSVLFQGYPNLEYIIMDGGSADNSVKIIKKYEPWISYWVSEKDRGQAHAVNKGWAIATGEILGWLNSDDFYMTGALHQVALAYKKGARGLIYGDCQVADENSSIRPGVKCMVNYSLIRLLTEYTMPQPAVFVTKEFADELGLLNEALHYAMDFDFFLRAWSGMEVNRFYYIPDIMAVSREHDLSKCSVSLLKGKSRFLHENIYVLNSWWKRLEVTQKKRAYFSAAFSRSLYRQARFLLTTRDYLSALKVLTRAAAIDPATFFRRMLGSLAKKFL